MDGVKRHEIFSKGDKYRQKLRLAVGVTKRWKFEISLTSVIKKNVYSLVTSVNSAFSVFLSFLSYLGI
jgi:hypothetical protein